MANTISTEKVRCCGCTSDTCKSSVPSPNSTEKHLNADEKTAEALENHQKHGSSCGSAHKILEQIKLVPMEE
jgi:hypothetical protein